MSLVCLPCAVHSTAQLGTRLDDRLIEPVSIIAQYRALIRSHPDAPARTFLKALPDAGHIELTLSPDERAIDYIIAECLKGNVKY